VARRRIVTADDFERLAGRRLPRSVFDAIAGGAGDETTIHSNRAGFQDIVLRPRALADVAAVDASTTILGQRVAMPLILAPTGSTYMCDPAAEFAIVRATARAHTIFALSSVASAGFEDLAAAAAGPLWYQWYPPRDRSAATELLSRLEASGYPVLCVTIDTPLPPRRDRDIRNGLTKPLRITPELMLGAATHPRWAAKFLFGRSGIENRRSVLAGRRSVQMLSDALSQLAPVTKDDLRWLRDQWRGKLVVKGVMRPDEVPQIIDLGADGIVVSNHGGRNLDSGQASILVLPEIVEAADGRVEVFVDGGIRRGTDVIKALGLGARACLIGRPYVWALAGGGEAGVDHLLRILQTEIEHTMAFAGCATVSDVDATVVKMRGVASPTTESWRPAEPEPEPEPEPEELLR
jgi:isopentenyl diphosphate isomerase/L-lactate dehydrogenase-like FMN-dependent dehydrogenase